MKQGDGVRNLNAWNWMLEKLWSRAVEWVTRAGWKVDKVIVREKNVG